MAGLAARVGTLEAEKAALELENAELRRRADRSSGCEVQGAQARGSARPSGVGVGP